MYGPVPRLRHRSDFLRVARDCRKWAAPGLVLQACERSAWKEASEAGTGENIRVGFTVTRKLGNSVTRNRIRRRLRAVADRVMPRHAKRGYDYVVIGRAKTKTRRFDALLDDLESALKRVDAYETDGAAHRGAPDEGVRRS